MSFRMDRSASVRFSLQRRKPGRRVKGQCRPVTARNRSARPCVRFVSITGRFDRAAKRGPNAFRFTGRLAGRTLAPGRYRLVASPRAGTATGSSKSAELRIR